MLCLSIDQQKAHQRSRSPVGCIKPSCAEIRLVVAGVTSEVEMEAWNTEVHTIVSVVGIVAAPMTVAWGVLLMASMTVVRCIMLMPTLAVAWGVVLIAVMRSTVTATMALTWRVVLLTAMSRMMTFVTGLVVRIACLRRGRGKHGETGSDGEKGGESFHGKWGRGLLDEIKRVAKGAQISDAGLIGLFKARQFSSVVHGQP